MCKYHVQYQALEKFEKVLPVPKDFPLKQDLDPKIRQHFIALNSLVKKMYWDMAENPENYGVLLVDIHEQTEKPYSGFILDSENSLKRLMDVIYTLFINAEIEENTLKLSIKDFKEQIKKNQKINGTKKVDNYKLILNQLINFGFVLIIMIRKNLVKMRKFVR